MNNVGPFNERPRATNGRPYGFDEIRRIEERTVGDLTTFGRMSLQYYNFSVYRFCNLTKKQMNRLKIPMLICLVLTLK